MWLVLYFAAFWGLTSVFILIRSLQKEGAAQTSTTKSTIVSGIIKPLPAGLAALFVFLLRPSDSPFYLLMVSGLAFCLLGDIGIDVRLLLGLVLFLFAQAILTVAFVSQSLVLGINLVAIIPLGVLFVGVLAYFVLFMRYLSPSLGKYRVPVFIYASMISAMLYASLLLWLTAGTFLGILVVAGVIFFVTSDSLLGIREFHHKLSTPVIKVSGTYYLAIFLLSLSVLVYQF
ncbi:MAG: lysoplasmalogenase family protein [Promethearchaeota archaeon]